MAPDLPDVFFPLPGEVDPAARLRDAVVMKNYSKAYAALRKLREPLSGKLAESCLTDALSCTPRLFREILEHCEPGEYANSMELTRRSERGEQFLRVYGTILTLAAALDKPEHAAILLEKGWDVNARAPASIQALFGRDKRIAALCDESRANSRIACGGEPDFLLGEEALWVLACVTPLAAALACGGLRTAKVLLARSNVQKLENPAVSAAAVIALHGDIVQQWCLERLLETNALFCADIARELLVEHAPDVAGIAALCTPDEFALRLSGAPCSRQRLLAAAEALCAASTAETPEGGDEKLFLLLDRYPELETEQRVRDRMLNTILARLLSDQPCDALLDRWKDTCGESRDISNAEPELVHQLTWQKRTILDKLAEGGTLRALAESEWLQCDDKHLFSVLIDRVEAYPAGIGVNGAVHRIMQTGDVRLMRRAAERGALRCWRRDELLEALRRENGGPALRALVLALPEGQIGSAAAYSQDEGSEERRPRSRAELAEYLTQMWEQPLCAEECRKRLRLLSCRPDDLNVEMDGIDSVGLSVAACCGRNPELLRALLEDGVCDPDERGAIKWRNTGETLTGTMLCMAAAAGRTEQVNILLDRGLDPNEDDVSQRSVFCEDWLLCAPQVVTPLYMALEKGQSETAELLRARGGYAYPARE